MNETLAHLRIAIIKDGANEQLIFVAEDGKKYAFATGKQVTGRIHRTASRADIKAQPAWLLELITIQAMKYWHSVIAKREKKAAKAAEKNLQLI